MVNRLVAALISAALSLCDWIAGPLSETEADWIREREEADKAVPLHLRTWCAPAPRQRS